MDWLGQWLRFRLRTVLLAINLVILVLPLGGLTVLRLYESALIRQTESELIAQAAVLAAAYLVAAERLAPETPEGQGTALSDYGMVALAMPAAADPDGRWRPRPPVLDLASSRILPKPPPPQLADTAPDALAARIGAELAPVIRQAQRTTLAGIRILDAQGVITASTVDGEHYDLGQSMAGQEEVERALRGEPVSTLRWRVSDEPPPALDSISRGTRVRVTVTEPILREGRVLGAVLLVRTPANITQAIYGKREQLLYAGLVLFGVVLMLSLLTSLTISRPVARLIHQAHRAERGETGAVAPLRWPGTREIAELSESVASLARTLEDRARYIRDFAAHVSHEFKTPLTAIQGSVELLRDHADEMSAEERARFLGILAGDAQRLENLVRKLLELARADVMQVGDERAEVAAVLPSAADRFAKLRLQVQLPAQPLALAVRMAPETLDSVVSTLLDNARQHGGEGAQARVDWGPIEGGMAWISVSDNGSGISEANRRRIFEPFFTTRRDSGNTGLGLSIIRSLLRAHGGDIELLAPEQGTAFRIRLPQAATPATGPAPEAR